MLIKKQGAKVDGSWAKVGEAFKDGDRIKILDAGRIVEGDYGPRHVFKILNMKREEYNLSVNRTSLNNLAEGFGEESENWTGKVVNVFVVRQMVGDGLKNVVYLAPEGWTMDEEGHFGNPSEVPAPKFPPKYDIEEADEIAKNLPF